MHTPPTLARTVLWLLLAVAAGVCLSQANAQTLKDDVATAILVEGRVSVIQNGREVPLFQKMANAAAFQKCTVTARELIVTGPDGHAKFQISDGSTFEVFQNSQVLFHDTNSIEDFVNLILGKMRVMIEHRNGPNPKKVSTPTAIISVRGTVFDVAVEDDEGTTLVSVEEGEVEVRNTKQPQGGSRTLTQGETFRIYPNQPIAKAGQGKANAFKFVFDHLANAAVQIPLGPGGVGLPGGGSPGGIPSSQGDNGKKKNPPPVTAPPPPGGGGL